MKHPHRLVIRRGAAANVPGAVTQDPVTGMEIVPPADTDGLPATTLLYDGAAFVEDGGEELDRDSDGPVVTSDAVAFTPRKESVRLVRSGDVAEVYWNDGVSAMQDAEVVRMTRLDGRVFLRYL